MKFSTGALVLDTAISTRARSFASPEYFVPHSLVVLLIWVYYSSQIVLMGAEFTRVYADRRRAPVAQG